jgi:hypothetical protein
MIKNIWDNIKQVALNVSAMPKEMLDSKIREKAIKEAKIRLMEAGLTMEEAGLEKSEVIVKEEEDKIRQQIKDAGGAGVIGALALEAMLG